MKRRCIEEGRMVAERRWRPKKRSCSLEEDDKVDSYGKMAAVSLLITGAVLQTDMASAAGQEFGLWMLAGGVAVIVFLVYRKSLM